MADVGQILKRLIHKISYSINEKRSESKSYRHFSSDVKIIDDKNL